MDMSSILKAAGITGGLASAGQGLYGMFGKGQQSPNPADIANQYYNQIPGMVAPLYQPWIHQGIGAQQSVNPFYLQMLQNPGGLLSQLGSGYKESPGYQFKLQQGLGAAGNAAAAGGTLGTPQHQQNAQQIGNDIASQDFNDYLQNVLGLFGGGLGGQEKQINRGYQASTAYGDILGNNLAQQGANAYAGQAGQNAQQAQQRQSNWGNTIGGLAQLLGSFFL